MTICIYIKKFIFTFQLFTPGYVSDIFTWIKILIQPIVSIHYYTERIGTRVLAMYLFKKTYYKRFGNL